LTAVYETKFVMNFEAKSFSRSYLKQLNIKPKSKVRVRLREGEIQQ